MKRTPLKRGKGLARKAPLRAVPGTPKRPEGSGAVKPTRRVPSLRRRPQARVDEPGRAEWKAARYGKCSVCRRPGRLVRHHVVRERDVRQYGGNPWDLRNSMDLTDRCSCHSGHHHRAIRDTRISLSRVPREAIAFAVDLMGQDRADLYFARFYRPD